MAPRCPLPGCGHLAPTPADVKERGDELQLLIYAAKVPVPVPWTTLTRFMESACETHWVEVTERLAVAVAGPHRGHVETLPHHLEADDREWDTYGDLNARDRWRYRLLIAERDGMWFGAGSRWTSCGWCGEPIRLDGWGKWAQQPGFPTIDHIEPRSTGGEHVHLSNMRLVHWACNQERSAHPALTRAEWEAS